jgi:hypothetical protein
VRPSGRLCNALLGLDLNETGYLHSKRRDPGWPVCSFAFKSIAYSFHLRISPLKSASVHECVLLVFGLLGTSPDENSALLEVSPSMDATSQAAQK